MKKLLQRWLGIEAQEGKLDALRSDFNKVGRILFDDVGKNAKYIAWLEKKVEGLERALDRSLTDTNLRHSMQQYFAETKQPQNEYKAAKENIG